MSAFIPVTDTKTGDWRVRYGSWPCQNAWREGSELAEVGDAGRFRGFDYAWIAVISG
jgi:hypothetical protein